MVFATVSRVITLSKSVVSPSMSALPNHYETLREVFDYDRPTVDIGDVDAEVVDRAFAATTDEDALREAADKETLFVASAGLTGPPHVGTVAQMFAVKRLREAGFDTEFLLADYEKVAAGGRDLDVVRGLADDYRAFLDGIGYDGRVRTQYDATGVMQTAFRLAPHFDPDASIGVDAEPTAWVEALQAAYERDRDGPADEATTTDFGGDAASLLCLADFVHPTLADGYDQTVFVLGVDEHALVRANEHHLADAPVDAARLAELEAACRAGGGVWDAAVEEYADFLADLSRAWPSEGKRSTTRGC